MSVQKGSSKDTYESALDYWLRRIEESRSELNQAQKNLEWSIDGYIKLIQQFAKDHPQ